MDSLGHSTNIIELLLSAGPCYSHGNTVTELIASSRGRISAHPLFLSLDKIHSPSSEELGVR